MTVILLHIYFWQWLLLMPLLLTVASRGTFSSTYTEANDQCKCFKNTAKERTEIKTFIMHSFS